MICYFRANKPVLQRPIEPGQYTSKDYAALARANGVVLSRGATGCAYDNAVGARKG
jgi:transposase InsO family protein